MREEAAAAKMTSPPGSIPFWRRSRYVRAENDQPGAYSFAGPCKYISVIDYYFLDREEVPVTLLMTQRVEKVRVCSQSLRLLDEIQNRAT